MRLAFSQHDGGTASHLLGGEQLQAGVNRRGSEIAANPFGDDAGNRRNRQFAGGGQQPVAVGQVAPFADRRPFAFFVEFADDTRADILAPVVQLFFQLVLKQLALFLDHQDLFQPFGKMANALRLQRPDHANLVQANANIRCQ